MSEHHCHWPGCDKPVPPRLWGCRVHWFRLPKELRDRIWAEYQPGQEITKTPSQRYIEAATDVQKWIYHNDDEARAWYERLRERVNAMSPEPSP